MSRPRVLVVDDSATSRAKLAELLEAGGCEVVGRAMDGGLALRLALERRPDVITCDLEMPRMDGFTFIRLLRTRVAIPIIVVTSDDRPEAALQALDLGARDFVVKPGPRVNDLEPLGPTLVSKIQALASEQPSPTVWDESSQVEVPTPGVIAIGASTGGPGALRDILDRFVRPPRCPVVVAQHMPVRFTRAFADRLARSTGLDVREVEDGAPLRPGMIRIGRGGAHVGMVREGDEVRLRVIERRSTERWAPSVDRLFQDAAVCYGDASLGVVLTGMGRDGARGARALERAGANLWCESGATAVIDGMPSAAAEAHRGAIRVPLDRLALLVADAAGAARDD